MALKRRIILILLLTGCGAGYAAQKATDSASTFLQTDYTNINYATPDTSAFIGFRHDPDFNYSIEKPPISNLLQLLLFRFSGFLSSLFRNRATSYVFFILFAGIFIFLSLKLFDKKVQSVFIFSGRNKTNVTINEVNIGKENFDKLINDALLSGNFQVAVRFLYHKLLFHLNLKKIIELKSEKTSSEFAREISDSQLNLMFRQLSGTYNYVWFGKFELDEIVFRQINEQFSVCFNWLGIKEL